MGAGGRASAPRRRAAALLTFRAGGQLVVSSWSIGCGGDVATTYSGHYAYAYYYYCYYCYCYYYYYYYYYRGQWCARSCEAVRDLMAV